MHKVRRRKGQRISLGKVECHPMPGAGQLCLGLYARILLDLNKNEEQLLQGNNVVSGNGDTRR